MSINQKSGRQTFHRRFVSGSLVILPCLPECTKRDKNWARSQVMLAQRPLFPGICLPVNAREKRPLLAGKLFGRLTMTLNVNKSLNVKMFICNKVFSQWRPLKQCKILFFGAVRLSLLMIKNWSPQLLSFFEVKTIHLLNFQSTSVARRKRKDTWFYKDYKKNAKNVNNRLQTVNGSLRIAGQCDYTTKFSGCAWAAYC